MVRPGALGALERRDGVARRDHACRQRPRPPRAGRGVLARPDVDEAPQEAEARARGRAGRVEARREVQPPPAGEARGDVRGGQEALRCELRDGAGDGLLGVGDSGDGLVTSPPADRSPTPGRAALEAVGRPLQSFLWAAGSRHARPQTAKSPEAPSRSNEMRFRPADIRVPNVRRADTPSSGAATG